MRKIGPAKWLATQPAFTLPEHSHELWSTGGPGLAARTLLPMTKGQQIHTLCWDIAMYGHPCCGY